MRHTLSIVPRTRLGIPAVMVGLCLAILVFASPDQFVSLADPVALSQVFGRIGPLAVIVLLALAVVVSPIPSGPIAMAAGAVYGTVEGGALTAIGALLGAVIAFGLSRNFGFRPIAAMETPLARWITRPRPQGGLALAVLASRLIPFISFDAVSYLAGLTAIKTQNFILATAIGVLPASFAFAAMGAGMGELDSPLLFLAAFGVTLILPLAWLVAGRARA